MSHTYADPTRLAHAFARGWGFRLLVQALPDGVLAVQPDGTVAYASVQATVYFNRPADELIGCTFSDLVAEADRSAFPLPPYTGRVGSWDFRPNGEDCADTWLNASVLTPVFEEGDVDLHSVMGDAVLMLVRDIQRTDAGIRDRCDLYRRTLDAMDNIIVVTDSDAEDDPIVLVNEEFLKLTGYSREEVIGQNCRFLQTRGDGTRDDDQEGLRELYRAIAQGETASVLLRNYKKDGTLFYNELYVTPVRDVEGRVINFVGIQNDVTDEILARLEAEARERLLHHATEASSSGVFITDADSSCRSIVYVNPAFSAITGYSFEDAIGRTPWFWWDEDSDQKRRDGLLRSVDAGRTAHAVAEIERKGGEAYWAEVYADPVQYVPPPNGGRPGESGEGFSHGIVGIITDVTLRIKAETAERRHNEDLKALSGRLLEAQESERQELALELHDEIGQTLTALLLSLDAAVEMPGRAPAIIDQARGMVRDLQDSVRNLSLDLRPSMLDDLGLEPALTWLFERAKARFELTVHADMSDSLPPLPTNIATAAYRIVQEALTNVAKHADVGDVAVQVRMREECLYIQVRDAGRGIDIEKAASSRIGLRGMVERAQRLGGSLSVKSQPGNGTTVAATLPVTLAAVA